MFPFTGKQLHCFLGLSSFLASSFHYWQEGAELGQDYPTNAQGLLNDGFFNYSALKTRFFSGLTSFFFIQVHIEFTEGEDKITLEGPTKDVQMVQSQIEAIVTDLVSIEFPTELCLGLRLQT